MKENNNMSNSIEKDNKKQNPKEEKGKIWGVIFFAWFFASIIALMYFSKTNQLFSVAVFGQYFLVFGLLGFNASKNEKGFDKYFPLIFALVGLICIIVPLLMANPDFLSVTIIWDNAIPALMLLAFVLSGFGLIFIPMISRRKKLETTTYKITATIKKYKTTRGDSSTVYCPIYEFYYNGKEYLVDDNSYTNVGVKPVGTNVELLIDPNNPEEFLTKERWNGASIITLILGIMFLLMSLPIFIYFITNNPLIA